MRHNEYDEVEEFDEVEDVEEDLAFSLTDQFYIRRNGKVKGPMDAKRIRKLVKSKKLKPSDEVSLSVDGSWDRLSNAYKDIISGNYVDGTAAKLPPRMSNRKKKVAKPLDGVEWLGSEWHVARMAMYQKYRKQLHITAGVVLLIIVVGVPLSWTMGTNFWSFAYGNTALLQTGSDGGGKINLRVNKANFLKIQKDMSESQLKVLLGKPSEAKYLEIIDVQTYEWRSGEKQISVWFDADGISLIEQKGLD